MKKNETHLLNRHTKVVSVLLLYDSEPIIAGGYRSGTVNSKSFVGKVFASN